MIFPINSEESKSKTRPSERSTSAFVEPDETVATPLKDKYPAIGSIRRNQGPVSIKECRATDTNNGELKYRLNGSQKSTLASILTISASLTGFAYDS